MVQGMPRPLPHSLPAHRSAGIPTLSMVLLYNMPGNASAWLDGPSAGGLPTAVSGCTKARSPSSGGRAFVARVRCSLLAVARHERRGQLAVMVALTASFCVPAASEVAVMLKDFLAPSGGVGLDGEDDAQVRGCAWRDVLEDVGAGLDRSGDLGRARLALEVLHGERGLRADAGDPEAVGHGPVVLDLHQEGLLGAGVRRSR